MRVERLAGLFLAALPSSAPIVTSPVVIDPVQECMGLAVYQPHFRGLAPDDLLRTYADCFSRFGCRAPVNDTATWNVHPALTIAEWKYFALCDRERSR